MRNTLKKFTFLSILSFSLSFSLKYVNANAAMVTTLAETQTTRNVSETTTIQAETTTYVISTTAVETTTANSNDSQTTSSNANISQTVSPKKYVRSKLSPLKSKIVVIDPGHCKKHKGAHSNGLKEENVVLDISKACKNKLDNYGDITVYMTRTNNKCLKSLHLGNCLIARNNYAKRLNADFLVSMHINADDSPKKSGAMILAAYNSGYHKSINIKTTALGNTVLDNLSSLGIKNKGFWMRKIKGLRYKNGSRMDYYSIVRNGVLYNIPSLIIEHGYVTNKSDCQNYFSTKAKRYSLGEKDADSIISYYGLNKQIISGRFVKNGKNTYYLNNLNQKVTGWVKTNGKWYYFDSKNGKMKTGFLKIGNKKFYLNPSTGEMCVGWINIKGSKYLAKGDGSLVTNAKFSDGVRTYRFSASGKKI